MQFGGGTPALGVVFDSDMGNRIDTALALAVLFGLDGKNECRVSSLSTTKPNLQAAAFFDVLVRFYTGNSPFRAMPIGMTLEGGAKEPTQLMEVAAKYPHGIKKENDTAEPVPLIRNAFTAQQDGNSVAVLAGPATNLAALLDLPGAKELITRKSKYLVIADVDRHAKANPAAMKRVLSDWPVPIHAIQSTLKFPATAIEKDFAWSPTHPLVDAYTLGGTMPYDAPANEMAAVLYSVRPKEPFFKVSASGKNFSVTVDPAQSDAAIKVLTELASAKPVVRAPRFRPPVADKAKPADVKPLDVKPPDAKP